jgi:hypothetical protein
MTTLQLAGSGHLWAASLLFAATVSLLLGVFEHRCYGRVVGFRHMEIGAWDRLLIAGSIVTRTMLLLLPVAALGTALGAAGWPRVGAAMTIVLSLKLAAALAVDVRLQRMTGNHLAFYAIHLMDPHTWEWAGDVGVFVRKIAADVVMCIGIVGVTALVTGLFLKNLDSTGQGAAAAAATLLYLGAVAAVLAARRGVKNALALERVYNSFPVHLYLFSPARVPRVASIGFGVVCDDAFEAVLAPACEAARRPAPLDDARLISRPDPPHVVLIVTESFRADFMAPQWMPGLCERSARGLRFDRHYSISNNSDFGVFSLLSGRSPLAFDTTIEHDRVPQMCRTFKLAGYTTRLLSSATFHDPRMNQMMNTGGFDHARVDQKGDWPTRDVASLREVRRVVAEAQTPQLMVLHLMSSHYGYNYPEKYAVHETQMSGRRGVKRDSLTGDDLRARYANCVRFLDDELSSLIDDLDPARCVVAITGDHGESFGEDGARFHASRLSDVQTRVPMIVVGAGVPALTLTQKTSHVDLLPTLLHAIEGRPVPLRGGHGFDRLSVGGERPLLLMQRCNDSWEMALLHGGRRLGVNVRAGSWVTRVKGFCTPEGRIDAGLSAGPSEVAAWAEAMGRAAGPLRGA